MNLKNIKTKIKNNKKKTIFISIIVIILFALLYPKSQDTCGALAGAKACTRRYCIGMITVDTHVPPSSECIGLDLGTDNYLDIINR